jgi:TolA-binding protein
MSCERIEELLERASPRSSELAEIREHEASCAGCSALARLGPSLGDEMESQEGDAALTERALVGARRGSSRGRNRVRVMLLGAAALLIGTAALAGLGAFSEPAPSPAPPIAAPPVAPTSEPEPSPAAPPVTTEPKPSTPVPKPSAPSKAVREPTAAELFAEASELRRTGNNAEAIQRYELLASRFPGSREEITSRVLSGNLVFGSNLGRALERFDAYLATGNGALAEEAMLGRALALDRLARKAEARQAWQRLLERFPDSIQASRARARLAEDAD